MIQIPHNLLMPLAGGLAVVAVGVGGYIGRATAQPPAFLPSSQSVPLAEEPPKAFPPHPDFCPLPSLHRRYWGG